MNQIYLDKAVQSVWYYASGLPVVTNYGTVDAVDDKLPVERSLKY